MFSDIEIMALADFANGRRGDLPEMQTLAKAAS